MNVTSLNPVMRELDARGLSCPLPILKTKKVIGSLETGEILRVLSTDQGSLKDIASFCHQTGNDLLSSKECDGTFEFLIRRN
jgi:tRNA 2-thiouridine synthesizing protein A